MAAKDSTGNVGVGKIAPGNPKSYYRILFGNYTTVTNANGEITAPIYSTTNPDTPLGNPDAHDFTGGVRQTSMQAHITKITINDASTNAIIATFYDKTATPTIPDRTKIAASSSRSELLGTRSASGFTLGTKRGL
eukprot:865667-Prorocentrum_minimum.AAC.1